MISNWLSATLARRNIHYGWAMVGVTFLTALITAGTVGAPGVFIVPLQKEFGWTTAEISSALSIRFVLFGLMAPLAALALGAKTSTGLAIPSTECRPIDSQSWGHASTKARLTTIRRPTRLVRLSRRAT